MIESKGTVVCCLTALFLLLYRFNNVNEQWTTGTVFMFSAVLLLNTVIPFVVSKNLLYTIQKFCLYNS